MLSKLFGFDPSKHNIKTEVMAGITTFLTMAYILAVNPSIFSNLADKGMDTNAVFTATALAAIIGHSPWLSTPRSPSDWHRAWA